MINKYSSAEERAIKPNKLISIIDIIQPDLLIIKEELDKSNFKKALAIYEQLKKTHGYIIVDLVGIANASIQEGHVLNAEDFLQDLINKCEGNESIDQSHVIQARKILNEIFNKKTQYRKILDELFFIHDVSSQTDSFRLLSELADTCTGLYDEDAEQYLNLALSNIINTTKFSASDFSGVMDSILKNDELCSLRIANSMVEINSRLKGGIEKEYSLSFKKLVKQNDLDIFVKEIPEKLEPMGVLLDINPKSFLEKLFDNVKEEEPTFAYALA